MHNINDSSRTYAHRAREYRLHLAQKHQNLVGDLISSHGHAVITLNLHGCCDFNVSPFATDYLESYMDNPSYVVKRSIL